MVFAIWFRDPRQIQIGFKLNKEMLESHNPMVLIKDADGYDIEVDIIKFVEHLDEFHSSSVSTHKQNGHRFIVDEDFRNEIYKLVWN